MSWKRYFPRLKWPQITLHIPTWVICWVIYTIIGGTIVSLLLHGFVKDMQEFIPETETTMAMVIGITVFLVILAIFSQFISNDKSEKIKAKEAKMTNTPVDAVNGEISKKFFWGQPIIAIVAVVILGLTVLAGINEAAQIDECAKYVATPFRAVCVGIVAVTLLWAIVDRFLLRSVMDGTFYLMIEKPAIQKFLDGGLADLAKQGEKVIKTISEQISELQELGMTYEEAVAELKKQKQ